MSSVEEIGRKFVELCNQGKNFDVMKTMYADDIVSVESGGHQTVGKEPVIQKSVRWAGTVTIHGETVKGPYFNGVDRFAVHITFEVTPKATGQRVAQEEVGVYTVKDGKIVREEFYYQGKW